MTSRIINAICITGINYNTHSLEYGICINYYIFSCMQKKSLIFVLFMSDKNAGIEFMIVACIFKIKWTLILKIL